MKKLMLLCLLLTATPACNDAPVELEQAVDEFSFSMCARVYKCFPGLYEQGECEAEINAQCADGACDGQTVEQADLDACLDWTLDAECPLVLPEACSFIR